MNNSLEKPETAYYDSERFYILNDFVVKLQEMTNYHFQNQTNRNFKKVL